MILRKSILPKCFQDACVTGFVFLIIPVVYYFELFIVLPTVYEVWSGWHTFHFITGTVILWNICGNLIATMMADTSIKGRVMPVNTEPNWRFCSTCESVAPPRSWHCNVCNECILKRDHHCIFTSCCIGHHNQRFFVVFLLYMFIATSYASYYNAFFIVDFIDLYSVTSILKILFPLVTLCIQFTLEQCYFFLFIIIFSGCIFTGVLLSYHIDLIIRGMVFHERAGKENIYDLGIKANIIDALGDKWYLIWLSPFIESKLPRDGIHWETKESSKAK